MKIGAVILNYNCSKLSLNLAFELAKYSVFNQIIIVDNDSKEDEKQILNDINDESKKLKIIFNRNNTGYASGNNIGLKYLINESACDICFIINPDIIVSEETCEGIAMFLNKNPQYAIASTVRTDLAGNYSQRQYWHLPSFIDCLKDCFIVFRRKATDKYIYTVDEDSEFVTVDVIPGSFFAISRHACEKIGFLDEGTFLYNEENCLAKKIQKNNFKEALLLNYRYIHNHTKPSAKENAFVVFKRGYESKKHYIWKYILPEVSMFECIILKLCYKYSYIERLVIKFITGN